MRAFYWVLIFLLPAVVSATTVEFELAAGISRYAEADEVRWLRGDKRRFLSIYRRAAATPVQGGALLLHDRHTHPDWPYVTSPLRRGLSAHNWQTLSLALPGMPESRLPGRHIGSRLKDVDSRVDRGLQEFEGAELPQMVLIGHGLGATLALNYLSTRPDVDVSALVMVNAAVPHDWPDDKPLPELLAGISIPVLDIYGERSRLSAQGADGRLAAARAVDGLVYRQIRIAGADNNFTRNDDVLLKRVRSWLAELPERGSE